MKKKVLFVGSFKANTKDGSVGGQMFASKALINSRLKDTIDFIQIDTTANTVPPAALFFRLMKACERLFIFLTKLFFNKVDTVLIFCSDGLSFVEKGNMALIGKLFCKKVIFAPRSGMSKDDYERNNFMKHYMKFVLSCVDYIICQGTTWKVFYKKVTENKIADRRFVILQNWIEIHDYCQNNRAELDKGSGVVKILYLGWLEEFKGIFDLIHAIKSVSSKQINIEVSVYGSGSKLKEVAELINEMRLEKIVYLKGWANKGIKMKAFAEADIFVLPSHREGFPNSLLEAMASQLPIIATDVGGVSDLVKNEYNGILIDSNNIDLMSQALEKLIQNKEMRIFLGKNARLSAIANNSIEHACETLEGIF